MLEVVAGFDSLRAATPFRLEHGIDARPSGPLEAAHECAVGEHQIGQASWSVGGRPQRVKTRTPTETNVYFSGFFLGNPLLSAPLTTSKTSAGTENESATVLPEPPSSSDCIISCALGFDPLCIFARPMNPRTTSRRLLAASSSRASARIIPRSPPLMWPLTANHVMAGSRLATLSGRCALDVSASNRPTAQALPPSSDRTRFVSSSLRVALESPV